MKRLLLAVALMCTCIPSLAQVPVSLSPVARQQFFNQAGQPLSGGLVYTYAGGTSTPQATYADASGLFQNTNPLQLDSGGRGTIWLNSSQVYKMCVSDQSNVQQWCVDGIASIFGSANTFSQPQTFLGGGTLSGIWAGNPLFSGGPTFGGTSTFNGPVIFNSPITFAFNPTFNGPITATQLISTLSTGTPPLVVGSSTLVPNLNVSLLEGKSWETPGTIGSSNPSTAAFTNLTDGFLNPGGCVQAGPIGPPNLTTPTSMPCNVPAIQGLSTKYLVGNISLSPGVLTTVDSQSIVMPALGCPCRVVISYSYFWETISGSGADTINLYVTDGTTKYAPSQQSASSSTTVGGLSASQTTLTYANSTNVTFTVKAQALQTQQIDSVASNINTLQSYLELRIETSQ